MKVSGGDQARNVFRIGDGRHRGTTSTPALGIAIRLTAIRLNASTIDHGHHVGRHGPSHGEARADGCITPPRCTCAAVSGGAHRERQAHRDD
jgi:hypothetical protein